MLALVLVLVGPTYLRICSCACSRACPCRAYLFVRVLALVLVLVGPTYLCICSCACSRAYHCRAYLFAYLFALLPACVFESRCLLHLFGVSLYTPVMYVRHTQFTVNSC